MLMNDDLICVLFVYLLVMVLEYHFHEDEVCTSVFIFFGLMIRFLFLDSVLRFLRHFQSNPYLIELLCDAAYFFHPSYLAECMELDEKTKKEICRRATTPCTLKNIARKQIRTYIFNSLMKLRIDRAVEKLDLPIFLQRYLLFENA
jgi:hypothetical protein